MDNVIKNSKLYKYIALLVAGLIVFGTALTFFIQNFGVYDDSWGTDYSFDLDAIAMMLCSIAICAYSVLGILNKANKESFYYAFGTVSVISTFYPFGRFFRTIAKGKGFVAGETYFFIGLLGIALCVYLVFRYIEDVKNNK